MSDSTGDGLFPGITPIRPPKRKKLGSEEDAQKLWDDWVRRQRRPDCCVYGPERQKMLRERLALYAVDHLLAIIRWAYESEDPAPRFLRGENDRGATYLDLESLLRIEKLTSRIQLALTWAKEQDEEPEIRPHSSGLTLVLGRKGRRVSRT